MKYFSHVSLVHFDSNVVVSVGGLSIGGDWQRGLADWTARVDCIHVCHLRYRHPLVEYQMAGCALGR
mgnify:CR=1 FL=1